MIDKFRQIRDMFSSKTGLSAILVLAATLRIWHVVSLRNLPLFTEMILDSMSYDRLACDLASGNWMGPDRAFFQDPLYSYMLAVIYRVFGHDMLIVRLIQTGMGVATCALVYLLGKYVAGRAVGASSALIMALYIPAIFNEAEIEKTAVGMFLTTAALVLAIRKGVWSAFFTGVVLALAILTRGNLLIMIPFGILFYITDRKNVDVSRGTSKTGFHRLFVVVTGLQWQRAVVMVLGCALIFSPVLWRNHYVSGEWILTTSQAGAAFYTGNNSANYVGGFVTVPFVRANPLYEEDDFRVEAERRANKKLTPSEVSSFWFHESFKHFRQNTAFAVSVFLQKILLFLSDVELPDGWCMYFLSRYSPILRLPFFSMAFIFPLAALGSIVSYRKSREIRLLCWFILLYAASVILFYVFSRYRLYVVPPITVCAALGLQWLWRQFWNRNMSRWCAGIGFCSLLGVFSYSSASSYGIGKSPYINSYWHLADIYEYQGKYDLALELVDEAQHKYPERFENVCRVAKYHQLKGEHTSAIQFYKRCLELNGNKSEAWYSLGVSYEAIGEPDTAINCYQRELYLNSGHQQSLDRLHQLGGIRHAAAVPESER